MVLISHLSTYLSALYTSYLFYISFAYLTGVSSIYALSSYVLFTIFFSGFPSYENKHSWLIESDIVTIRIFVQSKCVRTPFTPSQHNKSHCEFNSVQILHSNKTFLFLLYTANTQVYLPTCLSLYVLMHFQVYELLYQHFKYFTVFSFLFCLRSYLLDWLLLIYM